MVGLANPFPPQPLIPRLSVVKSRTQRWEPALSYLRALVITKVLVNREAERPDSRGRCEARVASDPKDWEGRRVGTFQRLERARKYNSSANLHMTLT